MELGLCIFGLIMLNLAAFSALLVGATPKIRKLIWGLFYLSMSVLSYFWFVIFFPEFLTLTKLLSDINIYAWLSLISIFSSAFFSWLWLSSQQGLSKKSRFNKIVGQLMVVFSLFCLLTIATLSINARLEADIVQQIITK